MQGGSIRGYLWINCTGDNISSNEDSSNGHNIGQGTPQLSEYLKEPPQTIQHSQHGIGVSQVRPGLLK